MKILHRLLFPKSNDATQPVKITPAGSDWSLVAYLYAAVAGILATAAAWIYLLNALTPEVPRGAWVLGEHVCKQNAGIASIRRNYFRRNYFVFKCENGAAFTDVFATNTTLMEAGK